MAVRRKSQPSSILPPPLTSFVAEFAALAVPAALASLAYLNARWAINVDLHVLSALAPARIWANRRLRKDRLNLFYVLEEYAHKQAIKDKPCIIYGNKTWTFAQTHDLVLRYAGWLHHTHHVLPGEVVALDCMNRPSFLFVTLALWSLGALPAMINYNLTGNALVHSIHASRARVVIIDAEIQHQVSQDVLSALSSSAFRNDTLPVSLVSLTPQLESSLPYFPPHRSPDAVRSVPLSRNPAVLIFTSGTTGLPKPAILPWDRLTFGASFCARWLGLRPVNHKRPDRFYTAMPLYHSSGFVLAFCCCLLNATTLVVGHKFSTRQFWSDVRTSHATVIQYVGETLRYLMTNPPNPELDKNHSVRMAFGNGLRPDVWDRFKVRFNIPTIAEFYSATESSSGSFNLSRNSFSSGAIGRTGAIGDIALTLMNAIVKVDWDTEEPYRDPKTGFCVALPRGESGELLFRLDPNDIGGRYVGYFKNESATAKKVLRDVFKKGDAWFRTGDVVKLDKEGRLWFSDRIGDTFRWKSENVSTAEVAQVLGMHPMVQEANVYGVQLPGYEGRAGCAAILLTDNAFDTQNNVAPKQEVLDSMAAFALNSLPRYAVPIFVRVVKELQITGNNKQQKVSLRKDGADPELVGAAGDQLFWLKPGSMRYERFGSTQWSAVRHGTARL